MKARTGLQARDAHRPERPLIDAAAADVEAHGDFCKPAVSSARPRFVTLSIHRVRWRTDGPIAIGDDVARLCTAHENPTVIPTPVGNDDSTLAPVQSSDAAEADERCLMAELSIIRGGHYYYYHGHRYERLSDAVAYAYVIQGRTRRSCSSAGP